MGGRAPGAHIDLAPTPPPRRDTSRGLTRPSTRPMRSRLPTVRTTGTRKGVNPGGPTSTSRAPWFACAFGRAARLPPLPPAYRLRLGGGILRARLTPFYSQAPAEATCHGATPRWADARV